MSKPNEVTSRTGKYTLPLISGGILIVTLGIVVGSFRLFDELDAGTAKVRSYKFRAETSGSPLLDLGSYADKKNSMSLDHPKCEALYRAGAVAEGKLHFKEAVALYQQSIASYLADIGTQKLDAVDKVHLAYRYRCISDCYKYLRNYPKALENATKSCQFCPTDWRGFAARAEIYELMGRKDLAAADHKMSVQSVDPSGALLRSTQNP